MSTAEAQTVSAERITLINVIEVPAESIDQFIKDWTADKDFMIGQPGFIDGALHRSVQPDARFRFVNVARWASEDDWKAAIVAGEKYRAARSIDRISGWTALGIKGYPAIYREEMRY